MLNEFGTLFTTKAPIHLTHEMYHRILHHNPSALEGVDISLEENPEINDGLVCTGCGNRGTGKALFIVEMEFEIALSISNGALRSRYAHPVEKVIDRELGADTFFVDFQEDGSIVWQSNKIIRCYNCDKADRPHAVLWSKDMQHDCYQRGCGGCILCDTVDSRHEVLQQCAECFIPVTATDDADLRRSCYDDGCNMAFASDVIYGIKLAEIMQEVVDE